MARTSVPDSATSQFFINLVDNKNLDYRGPGPGAGYCVFGRVIEGLDVVDAIAKVQTGRRPPHADVPVEDVVLISAIVL
jgi:cyclophilin family peptidyl-prolyl cis-trans isomerase